MPFSASYNNLTAGPYQSFITRPDLNPPLLNVQGSGTEGLIFLAQRGVDVHQSSIVITDNFGSIVYVNNSFPNAFDFTRQTYQGNDVLTFWNGTLLNGYGQGNYLMFDNTLNLIANFSTFDGTQGDIHEFHIVNDTALVTIYEEVSYDLSPYGGPTQGKLITGRFQQIDLCHSSLLFDWKALDHLTPALSYSFPGGADGDGTSNSPWDWFHINSVDLHPSDGTFLVSSRHTATLFKINQTDGTIIWQLGGKNSSFTMENGTNFEWQHDARWRSDTEISLFDNAAQSLSVVNETQTRGLRLGIDFDNMTVSLIQELLNPVKPTSGSQGNVQYLANGNFWMGYGNQPIGAEYAPNGSVVSQFQTSPYSTDVESYRMFKLNFTSNPDTIPDIALVDGTVFMSWNGATEIAKWNIYSGPSTDKLDLFRTVNKTGFETTFRFPPRTVNPSVNYTQAGAVNRNGNVMALTQIVRGSAETVSHDQSNIQVTVSKPAKPSFSCLPEISKSGASTVYSQHSSVQFIGLVWVIFFLFRKWM